MKPKAARTFRIAFQNVNMLPESKTAIKSKATIQHIADGEYDIVMMAEVGLYFPKVEPENLWEERAYGVLQDSKAWFAYNTCEPDCSEVRQYGGVGIVAADEAVHRVIKSGKDPKGLGRWVNISLQGKEGHVVSFFSVYRPVENLEGANSVYQQHVRNLRADEEPRQAVFDDLAVAINKARSEGHHIIVGIDANENIKTNGPTRAFMSAMGLREAILDRHKDKTPPETYRRNLSKYPVDGIFTSDHIVVSRAGYLPYDEGIPSDHRCLWLDVAFSVAFGHNCPPLQRGSPRRLKASDPRLVKKYNKQVRRLYERLKLPQTLKKIKSEAKKTGWNKDLKNRYNKLHAKATALRIQIEKTIRKLPMGNKPWSPRLQVFRDKIALWEMMVRRRKKLKVSMMRIRRYAKKTGLQQDLNVTLEEAIAKVDEAYKSYKQACAHAENWRTDHQEALLDALADKNQSTRERELKTMVRHERQRRQSRNIKRARNKLGHGRVTKVYYKTPDSKIVECSTKQSMDEAIITENISRFSQSEQTPPMKAPLIEDMGYFGEKAGIQELLLGSYPISPELPQFTQEFLRAMQQPESARKNGVTSTDISIQEHIEGWRKQREATASEPSGLSFSHHKAAIEDPVMAEFDRDIRELPYKYGFSPELWRRITDVSILKKAGLYVVDKMRTIQLMMAEFNMNNKKLGRDVMAFAEAAGILPDDQYGSRKRLRSIMAALNKRLTMDILRLRKQAGALCSNDAKSCYDRIVLWVAIAALCRAGLAISPALSMALTLCLAIHVVSTAYGISSQSYGKNRAVPLQGVGQGNGCGPAVWAVISSVLITMMYSAGHGVHFLSPISMTMASFVCYAFVDDTDLVQAGYTVDTPGEEVARDMQQAVDRWEGGLRASGGALEPTKSHWYLIDFEWRDGRWRYRNTEDMPAALTVVDTCGTKRVTLERVSVDVGKETLGVKLAMDGNNRDQTMHLLEKTQKFAEEMRVATLSHTDVWFALERCIMMTIEYCLPAVTLTKSEWTTVLAPILKYVLPKAGIDSSFPRRLLFAPKTYQGLGLMHPWHRQCATHIVTMISESLSQSLTSRLLTQVIEGTRLEVGVSGYFWQAPFQTFKAIATPTWVTGIWEYLEMHKIQVHDPLPILTPFWSQDKFLMDVFSSHYDGERLRRLNCCRLFLRVTCLSEISTLDGSAITFNAWNGFPSCNKWNDYEWPRQPKAIPDEWWELWREALSRLVCNRNRKLRESLGYPTVVPKRWRWYYSKDEDVLYHREGGMWRGYSKRAISRVTRHQLKAQYCRRDRLDDPPKDLLPVAVYKPTSRDIVRMDGLPLAPLGLNCATPSDASILSSTLVHDWELKQGTLEDIAEALKTNNCVAVSDGSFKEGRCTAAFTLRCLKTKAQVIGVNALPGPVEFSDSFRGELAGSIGALEMVRWIAYNHGISSGSIILASDGQGAIKKASVAINRLKPNQSSFDLLQKIREQIQTLPIKVDWKWVKGHQTGTRKSLMARLNDLCDITAKAYWKHVNKTNGWHSSGTVNEGWQVWLGGDKLTSVSVEALYEWAILFDETLSPKDYWDGKHQLSSEHFRDVNWESIGQAQRSLPEARRRWLPKFLSGFLGTNQRAAFRDSSVSASCQRCNHPVEDGRHIVLCQGSGASVVWESGVAAIDNQLTLTNTDPEIQTAIISRLHSWYYGRSSVALKVKSRLVRRALVGQDAIGWNNFVYGRTHYLWTLAQMRHYEKDGSSKSPRRWVTELIKKVWTVAWDMWTHRNHVKFKHTVALESPVLVKLRSRLENLALSADDHWLESERKMLEFTQSQVQQWTESELRARIASLVALKKRVKVRVRKQKQGLHSMQNFMRNWMASGTGNS